MTSKIEEYLNSKEYKAWQYSFWKLYFENEPIDIDQEEELIREFENNLLFASIKLGSYYPKDED
ncbi:hypothetical protein [Methanobacterium sp. ACI-7]|uniref:hypothetical protein n=1 Tax=unclassified Methanobacterium TaxID=2627676 RepID=UPI0039C37BD3